MKQDPIIRGFRADEFEFFGQVGSYYDLLSDGHMYQVTTLLKQGQEFDGSSYHNGTYMSAIGVHYKEFHLVVEVLEDGNMAVNMDNVAIRINPNRVDYAENVTLHDGSYVDVKWHLYVPELGNAVQVTTNVFRVTINGVTPGDIENPPSEVDPVQPSYLNIEAALTKLPEWPLQGIIGETYDHPDDPDKEAKAKPHKHPMHPDDHYKVDQMFIQIGDYVPSPPESEDDISRRRLRTVSPSRW